MNQKNHHQNQSSGYGQKEFRDFTALMRYLEEKTGATADNPEEMLRRMKSREQKTSNSMQEMRTQHTGSNNAEFFANEGLAALSMDWQRNQPQDPAKEIFNSIKKNAEEHPVAAGAVAGAGAAILLHLIFGL